MHKYNWGYKSHRSILVFQLRCHNHIPLHAKSNNHSSQLQVLGKKEAKNVKSLIGNTYRPPTSSKQKHHVVLAEVEGNTATYIHLDTGEKKKADINDFLDSYINTGKQKKSTTEIENVYKDKKLKQDILDQLDKHSRLDIEKDLFSNSPDSLKNSSTNITLSSSLDSRQTLTAF